MGDVVAFPVQEKTCEDCQYASFSTFGIFCLEFREEVDSDFAVDCESYHSFPLPPTKGRIIR